MFTSRKIILVTALLTLCFPFTIYAATGSWSFNGTNQRAIMNKGVSGEVGVPALGAVFTVETFFKWTNNISGTSYQAIIERQNYENQEWGIFMDQDTGEIGATVNSDGKHAGANSLWLGSNSVHIQKGTWNHVAFEGTGFNSNHAAYEYKLFLNGNLVDTQYLAGPPLLPKISYSNQYPQVTAGGLEQSATGEPFNGLIHGFRISNIARYTTNFTIPTSEFSPDGNTVGLWTLSDASGADSSGKGNTATFYAGDTIQSPLISNDSPFQTSSSPTPKLGDANGDQKVNGADYIIWLKHYNTSTVQVGGISIGDFNNSSKVDGQDYVLWLGNYNR